MIIKKIVKKASLFGASLVLMTAQLTPFFVFAPQASAIDVSGSTGPLIATTSSPPNGWDVSDVDNISADDDDYISDNGNEAQAYSGFAFNVPIGATIDGMEVKATAKASAGDECRIGIAISIDGGTTYSTTGYTPLSTTETIAIKGGPINTSSLSPQQADMNASDFVVKLVDNNPGAGFDCVEDTTISVDYLTANVYYTEADTDEEANVTVKKVVINDNNGTTGVDGFGITTTAGALVFDNGTVDGDTTTYTADTLTVAPGTYELRESALSEYIEGSWNCGVTFNDGRSTNYTLLDGDDVTCTITNNDVTPSSLVVQKRVTNDDGGTMNSSEFNIYVNGGDKLIDPFNTDIPVAFGNFTRYSVEGVTAGVEYTISEDLPDGYTQTNIDISDQSNVSHPVVLEPGQSAICRIGNNDIPLPSTTLVVNKVVINNDGGMLDPDDFEFRYKKGFFGSWSSWQYFEADGTNEIDVSPGRYFLQEKSVSGYKSSSQGCLVTNIAEGQTKECTFTNNDKAPYLTLIKIVVNDFDGTEKATAWELIAQEAGEDPIIEGQTIPVPFSEGSKAFTWPVRAEAGIFYELSEQGPTDGYFTTGWSCKGGELDNGAVKLALASVTICTITNYDGAPELKLVKEVTNNNGGEAMPGEWLLEADGDQGFEYSGDTDEFRQVLPDTVYELSENGGPDGYSNEGWVCDKLGVLKKDSVVLSRGDKVTCTIVNDDQPAVLVLTKYVDNKEFNGDKDVEDFPLFIENRADGKQRVKSGVVVILDAGLYRAGEVGDPGYSASDWMGDCRANGVIRLAVGGRYECNITNTALPGRLVIEKRIINDNGGDATFTQFGVEVDGKKHRFNKDGFVSLALPAGDYEVEEITYKGYEQVRNSCRKVVVVNGETTRCGIVNDDIAPVVTVVKLTDPFVSDQTFDFTLSSSGMDRVLEFTLDTDYNDGEYSDKFTTRGRFQAGTVTIAESEVENWRNDSITCLQKGDLKLRRPSFMYGIGNPFEAEIGEEYICAVQNSEDGSVVVTKFNDYNENGAWDKNEPVLEDWEMNLTREVDCYVDTRAPSSALNFFRDYQECDMESVDRSELTGQNGQAVFTGVDAGLYMLDETLQEGWVQTGIYCSEQDDIKFSRTAYEGNNGEQDYTYAYVYSGRQTECFVGNYIEPSVDIEKTNDTTGPVQAGDEVTFTLTISVPGPSLSSPLTGAMDGPNYLPVTVTDNLQDEFDYVAGSFSAVSSERGDLVGAGITTDPNYASPGTWILTSLASNSVLPGEVITLIYRATVGANTPAGTYPTTASVIGYGNIVAVTATDSDDNEVSVTVPQVLAAVSSSPATLQNTGVDNTIALIAGLSLVSIAIVLGRKKNQTVSAQ